MGRKNVEKNISKDTERNVYYVYLNWGKGTDGRYHKTYETTSNLKEARKILKKHQEERISGKVVMPVRDTLAATVKTTSGTGNWNWQKQRFTAMKRFWRTM